MKYLNTKGNTLLLTILTIVLLSVIALGLFTITTNSNKTTVNERFDQSIYYIAEAGINLEKVKISKTLKTIHSTTISQMNALTYEEQQRILTVYDSFDSYYNSIIKSSFCTEYNKEIQKQKCSYINNDIYYENTYDKFSQQFKEQPVAKTTIKGICKSVAKTISCEFTINSKGFLVNAPSKKRTLEQTILVDLNAPPPVGGGNGNGGNPSPPSLQIKDMTVVTSSNITLTRGAIIYGDVASGGIVKLDEGASITGNIAVTPISVNLNDYLPPFPSIDFNNVTNLVLPNTEVIKDNSNKTDIIKDGNFLATNWMTDKYELNLNKDTYFKSFKVRENNTITLNIGNKDINLYIDKLDITQGHIKIIGSGKLNIFVKDSIDIKGSFNNNGKPGQVNFYYQGTSAVTFSNETSLFGSFYTKTTDLTLTGGAALKGNIYSGGGNISISGGVPTNGQYIIAPHAKINLTQGGNITGTVLAKTIYADGGVSINYGDSIIPIPVTPNNPIQYQPAVDLLTESPMYEI
ncbi:hypothetical protein MKX73_08355 [Solibacillus sp. FSL W7-1436]|uniref:DUF7305 domain-containing protein n=1 Tax=Solibacillus TaxID=648800 RepID=UPI0020406A76|nr:hypothetical protein [Solibacillus isronensis]MCM3723145.1 hypothetical protein [Solibacillus isronensis]